MQLPRSVLQKGSLKSFAKFTRKLLHMPPFLTKLQAFCTELYWKGGSSAGLFPEFCDIVKNTYFEEHLQTDAGLMKIFKAASDIEQNRLFEEKGLLKFVYTVLKPFYMFYKKAIEIYKEGSRSREGSRPERRISIRAWATFVAWRTFSEF